MHRQKLRNIHIWRTGESRESYFRGTISSLSSIQLCVILCQGVRGCFYRSKTREGGEEKYIGLGKIEVNRHQEVA